MKPHFRILYSHYIFYIFFSLSFSKLNCQIVTTICGDGTFFKYSGDGGPAIKAQINWPFNIITDKNGNMFFVDQQNYCVRRIDAKTNIISTYVGKGINGNSGNGGLATDATISGDGCICFDKQGNLYVSSVSCMCIRKIDAKTHIITKFAGSGAASISGDGGLADTAGLSAASWMTFDSKGNLYVSGLSNIRKIDARSHIITTIAGKDTAFTYYGDGVLAANARFNRIRGLTVDAYDNIYVTDDRNMPAPGGRIRKIDAKTGLIHTIVGNNVVGYSGDGGPALLAATCVTAFPIFDAQNNMYFCDGWTIRKVDAKTQIISTIAGIGTIYWGYSGDGGDPLLAQFDQPNGIAFDSIGNILIADKFNNRIRKITYCNNPVEPIIGSDQVCLGGTIALTNATAGGAWNTNDSSVITIDANGKITGLQEGIAVLSYTATNASCIAARTKVVQVVKKGNSFNLSGVKGLCTGASTFMQSSSFEGFWQSGNTNIAIVDSLTGKVTGNKSGITQIKYIINNACATQEDSLPIVIYDRPVSSFNASAIVGCKGDSVTFRNAASNLNIKNWYWKLGNKIGENNASAGRYFLDTGNFVIQHAASNTFGCFSDTTSQVIKILPYPTVVMHPNVTLIQGQQTSLQPVLMIGDSLSFKWTPAQYLDNTIIEAPIATPQTNMLYYLKIAGKGGCTVNDSVQITVLKNIHVPNIFSPNGDGTNDFWEIAGLSSYVNARLEIYSRGGQLIYSSIGYSKSWDGTFNGKALPIGTYYYVLLLNSSGLAPLSGSVTIVR